MSVNVFLQVAAGAIVLSLGIHLLRTRRTMDADGAFIVPLVFVLSGWSIVVFAMNFNPFVVVAALPFLVALFLRNSAVFGEMSFIFAVIGGLSFAMGALGDDTENSTKLTMVTVATACMGVYWMFDAPTWTAIVSWTLFALVASTPTKK